MLDEFIPQIEKLQAEGAIIILKWDGLRQTRKITVLVSRQETNFNWRMDSDNLALTLQEALLEYRAAHTQNGNSPM